MYYMVLAVILLHNMMVKEQMINDEVEDGTMYNTIIHVTTDQQDKQEEEEKDGKDSGYDKNIIDPERRLRSCIKGGKSCMTMRAQKTEECNEKASLQELVWQ